MKGWGMRKARPWALAAFALALAGCVATPPPPQPQAALPPPPAAPLPKPPPRKPPAPSAAAATAAAEPPTASPAPPAPEVAELPPPAPTVAPPPAPPAPRLDRLIGLNQPEVAQILGEPKSRAEAPPATIWRYDGSDCALDVYFYLDLQSQAMRALHYEVRSHDAAERSAQRCYETLLDERRANAEPSAGSDSPR